MGYAMDCALRCYVMFRVSSGMSRSIRTFLVRKTADRPNTLLPELGSPVVALKL